MNRENNIVKPVGLKGNDKLNHMLNLMGRLDTINENVNRISSVKISKQAPDGNVYAIVRENQEFVIKTAPLKENLSLKDLNYIGGLANKRDFVYESFKKADKVLNNKLISLFEAYGIETDINTFKSDRLIKEECDIKEVEEEELTETEDMDDLTLPKTDTETSGDNLDGDFDEDAKTPSIVGESIKNKPSILEAMSSDEPVLPEGYMDLIFKKKRLK